MEMQMILFRAATVALAVAGAMAVTSVATPAMADWHGNGWHRRWYGPGWGWGAPAYYYYRPPPVYYAPPVVYAPPPPPVYYSPGVSFGLTIR
jgi:hypothetical protein